MAEGLDILTCPFCGGKPTPKRATTQESKNLWTKFVCENIGCTAISGTDWHDTDAGAVAAWNTRLPPPLRPDREAMARIIDPDAPCRRENDRTQSSPPQGREAMSAPVRIQLSRAKGFRLQEFSAALNGRLAVKVDRSGRFGNPYRVGEDLIVYGGQPAIQVLRNITAAQAVEAFRQAAEPHAKAIARQLAGKNLACWCKLCPAHKDGKPFGLRCDDCAPCHSDPLGELANAPSPSGKP